MNSFILATIFFVMLIVLALFLGGNRKKPSNDFSIKDLGWAAYVFTAGVIGWWMLHAGK